MGCHGVLPEEHTVPQPFIVDIVAELELPDSDEVAETVNYAETAAIVEHVVGGESCNLIETLAHRIASAVLAEPRVEQVSVTVHKPHAPIMQTFTDVSVTITRSQHV